MPIIDEKWEKNRRIIDEHNKFSPVTNYRGRKNPILLNSILIGTINRGRKNPILLNSILIGTIIYILLTSIIDWLIG